MSLPTASSPTQRNRAPNQSPVQSKPAPRCHPPSPPTLLRPYLDVAHSDQPTPLPPHAHQLHAHLVFAQQMRLNSSDTTAIHLSPPASSSNLHTSNKPSLKQQLRVHLAITERCQSESLTEFPQKPVSGTNAATKQSNIAITENPPSHGSSSNNNNNNNSNAPALRSITSMAASNDDDGPSLASVNRGGTRRGMPASRAELQAAFEAACASQNTPTNRTFKSSDVGEYNHEDNHVLPSFECVGRGGTFRTSHVARQVPDTLKDLEFDGPTSSGSALDAASRVSMMLKQFDNGNFSQKESVLFEIQNVLPELRESDFDVSFIVSNLCARVLDWPRNLQVAAAETLQQLVCQPVRAKTARQLCDVVFRILKKPCELLFFEVWGDVLVRAIPLVRWHPEDVARYFGILDVKRAEHQLVAKRLMARLVGFFAVGLDKRPVEKLVLPRAIALATEKDVDIRGMIAESIANIGGQLAVQVVETEMWPTVRHLLKDSDARVRAAAIRSVADLVMRQRARSPDAPLFARVLPSTFLQVCADARQTASLDLRYVTNDVYLGLEIGALVFGKLIVCVYDHLSGTDARKEAFKAFAAMVTCNAPVVRRYCAYNLPGVASQLSKRYRADVCALVGFLANDSDAETRWKLAAGLHETVKLLASRDTVNTLYEAVRALLGDSHALVRLNAIRHFHEIVIVLAQQRGYASASRLSPLFAKLHLSCAGNWRAQELLATQLRHAAALVPPPTIAANILPVLYALAAESAWRVRKEGMRGVAACLRYLSDTCGREHAMRAFIHQWALSPVHWMRMGFIDAAEAAAATYSRILFRDTFAVAVLRLSTDPVANVRLRVVHILELVAPAAHEIEEFGVAVTTLTDDTDADVRDAMNGFDARLESVLKKAKRNLERDLDLEEEEQSMYARHLQAQRNVNRKKMLSTQKSLKGGKLRTIPTRSSMGAELMLGQTRIVCQGGRASQLLGAPENHAGSTACDRTCTVDASVPDIRIKQVHEDDDDDDDDDSAQTIGALANKPKRSVSVGNLRRSARTKSRHAVGQLLHRKRAGKSVSFSMSSSPLARQEQS